MGKDKNEAANQVHQKARKILGRKFTADWQAADGELVVKAIAAATSTGGAIRFGYTRDGGAYAVGILGDGEPYTLYCGSGDDLTTTLEEICSAFG